MTTDNAARRMLLRATRPMTFGDFQALTGGAVYGGTAITLDAIRLDVFREPDHQVQVESPTYAPRRGWSRVDLALRDIERRERMRHPVVSWHYGYLIVMPIILLVLGIGAWR